MNEQIFTNAQVVLADRIVNGSVVVRGGVITAIGEGPSCLGSAIDCDGDLLIPGLVELHTDNMERHIMPRPGTFWPVASAILNHDREIAAAGITTVFDALSVGMEDSGTLRTKLIGEFPTAIDELRGHGALKADHRLHLRCEVSSEALLRQLDALIGRPSVGLVSVMDHTPGQRQFVSLEKFGEYYKGKFAMSDAAFDAFAKGRIENSHRYSAPNRAAVVAIAAERGLRIASHDDATLAHVEEAVRDGITIAEFPTTMDAAIASHRAGMGVLMGGPNIVRGGSHSGNIAAKDLAAAGVLDIISSDYVPSSLLYGALLLAGATVAVPLAKAIALVTRNPARAAGLADRGEIAVGLRADLVRVKPGESDGVPVVRDVWRGGEKIA